jgi:hypothetical protein
VTKVVGIYVQTTHRELIRALCDLTINHYPFEDADEWCMAEVEQLEQVAGTVRKAMLEKEMPCSVSEM